MQERNKEIKPKIANIVATGCFPKTIDIVKLYREADFLDKVYEPETYPALLVKIEVNGHIRHITIYKNGKYIIAGATSEKEIEEIYKKITKKLMDLGYL